MPRSLGRGQRGIEAIVELGAIGQPGQRIPISEIHDARLAARDAMLHRAKRGGQLADLVVARRVRLGRVVAARHPPRDVGELAHRTRDAARDQQARDHRDAHGEQRDEQELRLQATERLQRRGHGSLQYGHDLIAPAGGQRQGLRDRVVGDANAGRVAGRKAVRREVARQRFARGIFQRARLQLPGLVVAPAREGNLKSRERREIRREGVADVEPHRDPGDRRRRQHRDDHHFGEPSPHQRYRACALLPRGLGE